MKMLNAMMARVIQTGRLTIVDAEGEPHVHEGAPGPAVTIRLSDPALERKLFLNPEMHAGEAYMDGTLTIEEGTLRDFLTLFALNRTRLRGHPVQKLLRRTLKRLRRLHQRNTLARSQQNVAHHYDLSNKLYSLFLDEGMNYSCAYFRAPGDSLEEAQTNKLRHIAAKLNLQPGQSVLDIGCGWGGMALYLAEVCGARVTGVTLSKEQLELARERAEARGLEDRITFELRDYREVDGPFDRIVSIGMFEHVGLNNYDTFFAKVRDLLAPDGAALLHAIGRKGGPGITGAWVRKYIFPGGYSPALSEVSAAVERSGLWITDIEILRLHYAETLQEWERRFQAHRAEIAEMLDERFCRMWEFYLILSEFSFRYGKHMVWQMQLAREVDALPITRDYMVEAEKALARAEARAETPAGAPSAEERDEAETGETKPAESSPAGS